MKYKTTMADLLSQVQSKSTTDHQQEQPADKNVEEKAVDKKELESRVEGVCEKCGGEECICGSLDEDRQLKDPSKEMMIVIPHIGKVIVINKSEFPKYKRLGWTVAEETELSPKKRPRRGRPLKEEDVYDNDRFIIVGNTAKKDNSNTPDTKNHVYAPNSKIALQLHKQGKNVYREDKELDENLDVRYDTTKKGWFDKQGKRRYLGIGQTNALMKKALDKAIKSGDWINPFKMKHGQKAENLELVESSATRELTILYNKANKTPADEKRIKELEKNLGMNEEIAFVVRYTDPQNKKRFAIPYKDQKSADDKADQLKKDGVKEIGVTKDVLKPGYKFKEELEETIKIVPVHKSVLPDHLKKLFDKDGNFIDPRSQAVFDKMVKDAGGSDAFRKKYNIYKKEDGSVELREFTDAQIKTLEKEYAPLKGRRMSTDMLNKMNGMIKRMSKAQLNKLAQANVPFVTSTAKSELVINRGMKWTDFKESLKIENADSETATPAKKKKGEDKDATIDRLEKENQLLKVRNLEKTQKTVEPNKDTGEVPLKVGLAQKILKDIKDGKKVEMPKKTKKEIKLDHKPTKVETKPTLDITPSAGGHDTEISSQTK